MPTTPKTNSVRPSFRPSLLSSIIFIVSFSVFCLLANWQQGRISEKLALAAYYEKLEKEQALNLNEAYDTLPEIRRAVLVTGNYLPEHLFLLDSKVYKGRPGYHVITPFKLKDQEEVILVNRGWHAVGSNRAILPEITTFEAEQTLRGHIAEPKKVPKSFEMAQQAGKSRLAIDINSISASIGSPVFPRVLLLQIEAADPLKRDWPEYDAKIGMHEFYVIHWIAVAILSAFIYIYFGFRKKNNDANSTMSDSNE